MCVLRTAYTDNILRFINTLIMIIHVEFKHLIPPDELVKNNLQTMFLICSGQKERDKI